METATCGACLHKGHSNGCTVVFPDGTRCSCPDYIQDDCPGSLGQIDDGACPGNDRLLKKHGPGCPDYLKQHVS